MISHRYGNKPAITQQLVGRMIYNIFSQS